MMSKAMHRFKIHSASTLRISGTIIEILAIIASVACIVCVSIMAGYESSMTHRAELKYVVRLCQGTFVLNVLYHMIFEFHRTCRSNKLIKWILDTAIIISVLPWIWHRPLDPWLPWLSDILFSRWYLYPVLIAYSVLTISNGIVRAIGKRTNPSLLLSGSFIVIILIEIGRAHV